MIALAKPLGLTEYELLYKLPFARGQQYLCALALQNGAEPIWQDESESVESDIEEARNLLHVLLGHATK